MKILDNMTHLKIVTQGIGPNMQNNSIHILGFWSLYSASHFLHCDARVNPSPVVNVGVLDSIPSRKILQNRIWIHIHIEVHNEALSCCSTRSWMRVVNLTAFLYAFLIVKLLLDYTIEPFEIFCFGLGVSFIETQCQSWITLNYNWSLTWNPLKLFDSAC